MKWCRTHSGPLPRNPETDLYLALAQVREENNLTRGLEQFASEIQKYKPAQAEFYIELADTYVKAGQPDKADPLYKEALRKRPDSLAAVLGLGEAQEKSGKIANAVATFRQATQLAPADASSWRQLGEAQLKLGALAEAAAALGKSLDLDPEVPEAHYALAMMWAADPSVNGAGAKGAGAESSYREAIRLQPDYSAAHMNLAILLYGKNQAAEAREHFESALRSHPEYALGHYNFGLMLIAQNRLDEARRHLEFAALPGSNLDAKSRADALRQLSELERPALTRSQKFA